MKIPIRAMIGMLVATGITVIMLRPGPLSAQEPGQRPHLTPDKILELLTDPSIGKRFVGNSAVHTFLRAQPPQTEIDALVDGLVELTRRDDVLVRSAAISSLLTWARTDGAKANGRGVRILEEVYNGLPVSGGGRGMILNNISELQAGPPAIQFLRRVALDENPGFHGDPGVALVELARMGEPGRAVLRQLHEQDLVPTGHARRILSSLAARGFRPWSPGG